MRLAGAPAAGLALCLVAAACSSIQKECGANLCVSHIEVQCDQNSGVAATDVQIELPKGVTGRQMFSLKATVHTPKGDVVLVDRQGTVTEKTPSTTQLAFYHPTTSEVRTIEGDGKVFKTRFDAPCS